ncbi:AI-2E family transporter, partial [Bacillus vallismortis]|nr:AI-2E family transporter [Bacillus vallismortis]
EPKILSKSIGIEPLATLISLLAGFKLFGFLGLNAGPAVLVIIQAFITTGTCKEIWSNITVLQKYNSSPYSWLPFLCDEYQI